MEGGGEDYLGCGTVRRSGDGAAVCGSWALASLRCVLGMVVLYSVHPMLARKKPGG